MPAPQRIYMPAGCLGDQVCYPERYADVIARDGGKCAAQEEAKMIAALKATGIEHLLTRESSGWNAEFVWENTLSGGEQQRLGLARVAYRRPKFAVLDECTSMVASDAEEELYRVLIQDLGVTPITLTQRLFLPGLHSQELRLGTSEEDGWSLHQMSDSEAK